MIQNQFVHEIHEKHERLKKQAMTGNRKPWCISPSLNLKISFFVLFVPFVDEKVY